MAQQGVEGKGMDEHSLARTGRMALYGGCVFGPGATLWYKFLQRKIVIPNKPNLEIVARVATDQTVFASTNLFLFLSSMALMEGNDPKQALQDKYVTAVKKNWMVWPAVQFTNFKYVPLEHRVLVVNIVSLGECSTAVFGLVVRADFVAGWNCYLSYLNSSSSGEHADVSFEHVSWTCKVLLTPSLQNPTYPPDI
jgi:protein Mpv17